MTKTIGAPPLGAKVPLKVDIAKTSNPTVEQQQNGKKPKGKK